LLAAGDDGVRRWNGTQDHLRTGQVCARFYTDPHGARRGRTTADESRTAANSTASRRRTAPASRYLTSADGGWTATGSRWDAAASSGNDAH